MSFSNLVFSKKELSDFKSWLNIDLNEVTWQGRYLDEFEDFWSLFFTSNIKFSDLNKKFDYITEQTKLGPLISWFSWLQNRLIVYTFIYKNISLLELSQNSKMSVSDIAYILRDYFVDRFPHLEEYFSDLFHIGNLGSNNLLIKYSLLNEKLDLSSTYAYNDSKDLMNVLEVTIYDEWKKIVSLLKENKNNIESGKKISKKSWKNQWRFFRDTVILLGSFFFSYLFSKNI